MVIKLYGAPPGQAPWFISIVTVASVVLAPFGGWLIDRFGERRMLALSCLIDILGNLVVVAAGSFAVAMAGRVVRDSDHRIAGGGHGDDGAGARGAERISP